MVIFSLKGLGSCLCMDGKPWLCKLEGQGRRQLQLEPGGSWRQNFQSYYRTQSASLRGYRHRARSS